MIVMKFGGSSVKDATAMKRVLNIVASKRHLSPLVVLSACGGITDRLIQIIKSSAKGNTETEQTELQSIANHHKEIIRELIQNQALRNTAFQRVNALIGEISILLEGVALLRECTPKSLDAASAYGELLSTSVFECAARESGLDSVFVDIRQVMITDSNYSNAKLNLPLVREKAKIHLENLFLSGKTVVTQGFIGSDAEGITTTIGRGGSDLSAAVLGAVLKSDEIQIWTDVPGILTADPRIAKNAVSTKQMSIAEVRELSFFGAKVLHPDTIKPAVENNIPVRVLSSFEPEHPGTMILETPEIDHPELHALTMLKDCVLININIPENISSLVFYANTLQQIINTNGKILLSTLSESVCSFLTEKTPAIINNYSSFITEEITAVCLVGWKIGNNSSDFVTNIISSLGNIRLRQILYGTSDSAIFLIIGKDDTDQALQRLHELILRTKKDNNYIA